MALSESIEYDKIEIVGKYRTVQVRKATVIKKDGKELTRSFERFGFDPGTLDGSDNLVDNPLSKEPDGTTDVTDEIKAVCNAIWTTSIKDAWNDLITHIQCFDQWNDTYTFRLKDSLFIEHGDPLSHNEMNLLTKGKECPCPIRTGLINWINNANQGQCCCSDKSFPSQQTICEKGSALIKDICA